MTDKVVVRKPHVLDLVESCKDLGTLRAAPPLIVSMALVAILTGNIAFALLTVGITSFVHAFWTRLLE